MKQISSELLVVGGGVAGCCAAVAAARNGVRTLLVERHGELGGTGYAGMFQHICGLYPNGSEFPAETLNGGLTREIVGLLNGKAPEKTIQRIGKVFVLPYRAGDLQNIFASLLEAETEASVLRNSVVSGVEVVQGNIRSVNVESSDGPMNITASMVVDCTGNGNVATMSGAGFEFSPLNERQLAGFSIRVRGVQPGDDALSIKLPYTCAQAVERGILPPAMRFTTFARGESPDEGFVKLSIDGEDTPERDERAVNFAHDLLTYLKKVLPAFKGATIVETSPQALDREGRRIIGDYLLTENDILEGRKFSDAIAKNSWPIELWDRAKGTLYRYLSPGEHYEIPFRCLTVKGLSNLLTAGRCISVSHAALGSTRVMGTCMALGEQAGLAAMYRIKNGEYSGQATGQS